MLRFDSELELESHELGRNLLSMVRDDDVGFVSVTRPVQPIGAASPFDTFRERLAAAALAIQGLRPQVDLFPIVFLAFPALAWRQSSLRNISHWLSWKRPPWLVLCD